jgi:signal transduction histidine kinase
MFMAEPERLFNKQFLSRLTLSVAFVLLGVAMVFAYQMWADVIESDVRNPFQQQERSLAHLRRVLNQAQTAARDYLLSPPNRTTKLRPQAAKYEWQVSEACTELSKDPLASRLAPQVKEGVLAVVGLIDSLQSWDDTMRRARGLAFMRDEVPALRQPVNALLQEISDGYERQRKELSEARQRLRKQAALRVFTLISAGWVFALAAAISNIAHVRDLEKNGTEKLEEAAIARADMQRLSARLLSIQEEERKRLARELHDGIGQSLTALRIEISRLQSSGGPDEAPGERIRRATALVEEIMRTVRDTSVLLRPSLLDDLGLEPALRWQVEDFARRTGIDCQFVSMGLPENLPDAWKTCVFRIVQEALHNCEKHAAPSRVEIRVRQVPERISVEVEDDGSGFELNSRGTSARNPGLGILGMRERASMLGGTMSIESSPGRGASVSVSLPLARIVRPEHSLEQASVLCAPAEAEVTNSKEIKT